MTESSGFQTLTEDYFNGVLAPSWKTNHGLAACLRSAATDKEWWYETERNRALLLTAAERLEELRIPPMMGMRHIDGDPLNNNPANIEIYPLDN